MPQRGPGGGGSTIIPRRYRKLATAAAAESGLPLKVVAAQIDDESGWNPRALSPTGAEGIAQFEPGTWREWGHGDPYNPQDAFPAYGAFMGHLLKQYHGNMRNALAAYNAGPGNLQAGYGYADSILSAAGEPDGATATIGLPYRNPFRGVQDLKPERIDMGVDYAGRGPVYALGRGRVTAVNQAWAGGVGAVGPGNWITYQLSEGPLKGRQVYVAENVTPKVRPGQRVTGSTVIGEMTGQGAGIETGFAAPGQSGQHGETLAASLGQQSKSGDPGATPSAAGVAFSDLIHAVGGKPGIGPTSGGSGAQSSGWPPPWLAGILAGIDRGTGGTGAAGAGLGGIASGLGSIAQSISSFEQGIEWFFVPSHWVRIFAGIFGAGFVGAGIVMMARTGRAYSVQVPGVGGVPYPGGELAPAIGIALVTIGAILLFIAFHNLPDDVTDLPGLISHLQQQVQTGGQ
jgi:hypothetical protein